MSMKAGEYASSTLTCICILGGAWNGLGIHGFEGVYDDYGGLRAFDDFVDAFRWVVDTYPYICYDSLRDMVVTVTDDSGYGSDDPDCALLTMRMPDPETLRACYDEHRVRMERAAD
ncbi:hypothetical protein [Paraburkholderia sp. 40]|uniref:hypothetical protein n=1 Tax=Paraburkholderia sp. 40 TaxID=2991059 RepID=UPI003D20EE04